MTLALTNLVPELQYWVEHFITNSSVNKFQFLSPVKLNPLYILSKSFIELLFNENYEYTEYFYKYTEDTNRYAWPQTIQSRLLIYPTSAKYFKIDESGTNNIFNLQNEDLTLLNALLQYRIDSTSVTIIDSTSVNFIDNILYTSYSNISSTLAKLIFLYLDLKIYGRITNYNNQITIASSTNILENIYESYILDEIFKVTSIRGI